jgi:hypothetical protein
MEGNMLQGNRRRVALVVAIAALIAVAAGLAEASGLSSWGW